MDAECEVIGREVACLEIAATTTRLTYERLTQRRNAEGIGAAGKDAIDGLMMTLS